MAEIFMAALQKDKLNPVPCTILITGFSSKECSTLQYDSVHKTKRRVELKDSYWTNILIKAKKQKKKVNFSLKIEFDAKTSGWVLGWDLSIHATVSMRGVEIWLTSKRKQRLIG